MTPNSYYIKISGKANIPEELELGGGYKVVLDGEIINKTEANNQDQTYDTIYLFKPALCEIQDKYGKIVKAKDMRSRSSQVRRALYRAWEADPGALDSEQEYDILMAYILKHIYELREEAKNEKKD